MEELESSHRDNLNYSARLKVAESKLREVEQGKKLVVENMLILEQKLKQSEDRERYLAADAKKVEQDLNAFTAEAKDAQSKLGLNSFCFFFVFFPLIPLFVIVAERDKIKLELTKRTDEVQQLKSDLARLEKVSLEQKERHSAFESELAASSKRLADEREAFAKEKQALLSRYVDEKNSFSERLEQALRDAASETQRFEREKKEIEAKFGEENKTLLCRLEQDAETIGKLRTELKEKSSLQKQLDGELQIAKRTGSRNEKPSWLLWWILVLITMVRVFYAPTVSI